MQAIKCHVALTSGGKQLPAIEVESQVALARLLMAHTQNTQEARQRLERAVSPLLQTIRHASLGLPTTWHTCKAITMKILFHGTQACPCREHADLVGALPCFLVQQVLVTRMPKALISKCQVACELARCQGDLGEDHLQRQTLQRALSLYDQCKSPEERYIACCSFILMRWNRLSPPCGAPTNTLKIRSKQ